MRVGQPVVHRHEADLGAVADEQESEREGDDARVELALHRIEMGPQQRRALAAADLLGRHVEQHGAEQRLRDADAAQDEVFPRRLEACGGAIERHEEHRREGGAFERDPEDAHIVGQKREQHREAEQLVHAVVQAQPRRRHLAVVALGAHVGAREQRRGEADEGRQCDQEDIQRIDEEGAVPDELRPAGDDLHRQHASRDEGEEAEHDIELHRPVAVPERRQHEAAGERDSEDEEQRLQLSLP